MSEKSKNLNKSVKNKDFKQDTEDSDKTINTLKTSSDDIDMEDIFKFIELYFKNNNIIYQHQYNSYDKFIDDYIKDFLINGNHEFYQVCEGNVHYKYRFVFENIEIQPPTIEATSQIMYPEDARNKNLNYSSNIKATVSEIQDVYDFTTKELIKSKVIVRDNNITVATIPIMVKSKYCSLNLFPDPEKLKYEDKYDPGGYFIINGGEKVIVPQERHGDNSPLITKGKNDSDPVQCQLRSHQLGVNGNVQILRINYYPNNNLITLKVPILTEFPIVALFRIMGYESDEAIINLICQNQDDIKMRNILHSCIRSSSVGDNKLNTREKVLDYLSNQIRVQIKFKSSVYSEDPDKKQKEKRSNLLNLLENNFLPHIEKYSEKIIYIAYCINRLLQVVLQRQPESDRDSFTNKRIDLAGDLLHQQFIQCFKSVLKTVGDDFGRRNQSNDEPISVVSSIKASNIEKKLNSALSTGKFGKYDGVGQALSPERLTYLSTILKLREINSPIKSSIASKIARVRKYHYSQIGFICPIETPEHKGVGLTRHLSIAGTVTVPNDSQINIIKKLISKDIISLTEILDPSLYGYYTKVFVNGQWEGMCDHGIELYNKMKQFKLNGTIDKYTAIVLDDVLNELRINCDGGRLIRPLFRVKDNKLYYNHKIAEDIKTMDNYNNFIQKYNDVLEFVDCDEQGFSLVAPDFMELKKMHDHVQHLRRDTVDPINRYNDQTYMNYNYCEIHPALLLGAIGTTVTMVNHNNNSRNILFAAQCKQSLGVYTANYRYRLDKAFLAYYSTRPLISSRTAKIVNYDMIPTGENCIVAIMSHTGYNQEDNIIINKAAIDRGLFRATYFDKIIDKLAKNQETGMNEKFTKPNPDEVNGLKDIGFNKFKDYDKLCEKGYVPEETKIVNNDVIIGKITPIQPTPNNPLPYNDNSKIYSQYIPAKVDKIFANSTDVDGYQMMKIRTRSEKIPQLGDKVTTRQAQKGTIGLIMAETDMPYTSSGIVPDIIFNPAAILGRMTMGYLLEMLLGKASAITGTEIDGTPFSEINPEYAEKILEENGYEKYGLETMYSGINGEPIECKIFVGPLYYLRLKHLSSDKISGRSTGQNTGLTRQPVGGKDFGGAKIGEMERDCIIAHGTAKYLKEKLLDNSDAYDCYVCDRCGMIAERIKKNDNQIIGSDTDKYICKNCNNQTDISKVRIPYAFKLFIQYLQTISCNVGMMVDK